MMDELSMRVRRAIAYTAQEHEMSIIACARWLMKYPPGMRKDFIGMEEVVHRDLTRTIEGVLTQLLLGEESEVEFDAERYTELANSGMSNVAIAKEMGFNSDAGMRYQAIRAGVYQKNPSGAPMKADKDKLSPAEKELVKQLAQANVGKVEGGGFKPMTVTIAKDAEKPREMSDGMRTALAPYDPPVIGGEISADAMPGVNVKPAAAPETLPEAEMSTELWTKLPGGYSDAEYPKEQFITIRIPFERKTPKADYLDRDTRKHRIVSATGDLKKIIDSVNEDIIDLLGAEDVERVQAYIDRHIG